MSLYSGNYSANMSTDVRIQQLAKIPTNELCADCNKKGPRWASYTLGVFLCIRCGGLHRRIGTHISRIKSITLDSWSSEQVQFMEDWGNIKANAKYIPDPTSVRVPTESEAYVVINNESERSGSSEMELFIRDKYERKAFMDPSVKSRFKIQYGLVNARPASVAFKTISNTTNSKTTSNGLKDKMTSDEIYEDGHDTLKAMGFTNFEENRKVLARVNGKVELAIELLLATRSETNQEAATVSSNLVGHNSTGTTSSTGLDDFFANVSSATHVLSADAQHLTQPSSSSNAFNNSDLSLAFASFADSTDATNAKGAVNSKNVKDSILALYSQPPCINAQTQQASFLGQPGTSPYQPRMSVTAAAPVGNPFMIQQQVPFQMPVSQHSVPFGHNAFNVGANSQFFDPARQGNLQHAFAPPGQPTPNEMFTQPHQQPQMSNAVFGIPISYNNNNNQEEHLGGAVSRNVE